MKRHCFALDLIDDDKLIAEYKEYHTAVWPEIVDSIKSAGVEELEIYLFGNRLFMIMEVNEAFSFEAKTKSDLENGKVQEWEKLMWNYQKAMPGAKPGEKWMRMEHIFKL
ncbi:L-rhamnose mutarotase [Pedobacter lithocola]|uniref:L-rhamnose mutarotase n=1 Tax=Pedobacter lithocola TaxID=1908239 RepID=A0ABV8PA07_9SPHI